MIDKREHARLGSTLSHLSGFVRVHGHRLFAEHVLPRFGRRDRLGRMQVNRGGEVDGIDLFVTQKLLPVQIPSTGAKLFGKRCREF